MDFFFQVPVVVFLIEMRKITATGANTSNALGLVSMSCDMHPAKCSCVAGQVTGCSHTAAALCKVNFSKFYVSLLYLELLSVFDIVCLLIYVDVCWVILSLVVLCF